MRPQQDHPQDTPATAPRVLKAPPAATEPPPAASTTATTEAFVCPPPSLDSHHAVPASMAMGALTA